MADYWADLTLADLEDMGITIEDIELMLAGGGGGYGQYGVLDPIDISPQATQWDVLDAQKTARAATAPPSPTERRLTRNFIFPNPDEFSYDAALQSTPYIRQLLIDAVAAGEQDPFKATSWLAGEEQKDEWERAVEQALPDFERLADERFYSDARWATDDEDERRALLLDYLQSEGENWLAGAAPSASRNVSWADWAENRRPGSGEMFPAYEGAGFDQGGGAVPASQRTANQPMVRTDPETFTSRARRNPEAAAQMNLSDFRKTYHDVLRGDALMEIGDRYEDPSGGYWVIEGDELPETAVQRRRRINRRREAQEFLERHKPRNRGRGGGPRMPNVPRWIGDRIRSMRAPSG